MNTRTALTTLCIAVVLALTACTTSSTPADKPKATAVPDYEVVEQEARGHQRTLVVEVDSTKNLRAVFDSVARSLSGEGGYIIWINCSTGGTKHVDNRLANGQYAIGRIGQAVTGLKDREAEFSTNDDRKCPDKAPSTGRSTEKTTSLPPEPTGTKRAELLHALAAVNRDIVKYEEKAIDAARNQCSSVIGDSPKADWAASQRFTYKDVVTTEAQGKAINDALKASGFCKV